MGMTANLTIALLLTGIIGFAVIRLIQVGRDKERLKNEIDKTVKTAVITKEVLREREHGETEKDLESGQF